MAALTLPSFYPHIPLSGANLGLAINDRCAYADFARLLCDEPVIKSIGEGKLKEEGFLRLRYKNYQVSSYLGKRDSSMSVRGSSATKKQRGCDKRCSAHIG